MVNPYTFLFHTRTQLTFMGEYSLNDVNNSCAHNSGRSNKSKH